VRPDPLTEAAARRHELTRSKAIQALRAFDAEGAHVTFETVARAALLTEQDQVFQQFNG
jgi:hypothetical protein